MTFRVATVLAPIETCKANCWVHQQSGLAGDQFAQRGGRAVNARLSPDNAVYSEAIPASIIPVDVSITDFTLRHVDALADKPAIIDGPTGRTVTFKELREGVQLLAGGLAATGFGPGSTLALMAPNIP
ncbi:4-coumarate--CoA ligase 1 [Nymphon striatum]|nr:4-coumarate--CoA ligase 1 [Nymphon striatum]